MTVVTFDRVRSHLEGELSQVSCQLMKMKAWMMAGRSLLTRGLYRTVFDSYSRASPLLLLLTESRTDPNTQTHFKPEEWSFCLEEGSTHLGHEQLSLNQRKECLEAVELPHLNSS